MIVRSSEDFGFVGCFGVVCFGAFGAVSFGGAVCGLVSFAAGPGVSVAFGWEVIPVFELVSTVAEGSAEGEGSGVGVGVAIGVSVGETDGKGVGDAVLAAGAAR